jgi:hypothetical protein
MPVLSNVRSPIYHHFVLLVWEERDSEGMHVTWRFSLLDSQKEARIGFKNVDELKAYLESWMKNSSVNISPKEN